MFLQEVLFHSQDKVDDNNGSVNKSYRQHLVVFLVGVESTGCYLVRHCEFSYWLVIWDLTFQQSSHGLHTSTHDLLCLLFLFENHLTHRWLLRSVRIEVLLRINSRRHDAHLDILNESRQVVLHLLFRVQTSLHYDFRKVVDSVVLGTSFLRRVLYVVNLNIKCVFVGNEKAGGDEVSLHLLGASRCRYVSVLNRVLWLSTELRSDEVHMGSEFTTF